MQFLRVVADRAYDEHGQIIEVSQRDAGVLRITDKGERLLSIFSLPGITFRILDAYERLPTIR